MEDFVYLISNGLIFNLLTFVSFWEIPGFKKKQAFALLFLNTVIKILFFISGFGNVKDTRFSELVFSLIGLGIYHLCIPIGLFQLLFYYLLIVDYLIVVRGIVSYVSVLYLSIHTQSWGSILLGWALYTLIFPLMTVYTRRAYTLLSTLYIQPIWHTIWLIPAANTVMVLLNTNAFDDESVNARFLFSRILLLVGTLATCILLLYMLKSVVRETVLKEQLKYGEQILSLQREQYSNLQKRVNEVRRTRHDLREHLRVLRAFLAEGKTEELRNYIENYTLSLPVDNTRRYCKNAALDSLLHYYAEKCADAGIVYQVDLSLPEQLPVPDSDLCVVIGDVIENGMEICAGQQDAYIRVAAQVFGKNIISIVVDHTAKTSPLNRDEERKDKISIRAQVVRFLAKQCHGTADFRWGDGVLYASILLNPLMEDGRKDT